VPKSVIVGVSPHTVRAVDLPFHLAVYGEGFQHPVLRSPAGVLGSQVLLNDQPQRTEYGGADTLWVWVDPSQWGVGDVMVRVRDPDGEQTEYCIPLHIRP
jgi:hypothetical protein